MHVLPVFSILPQERGAHKEVNHMNNNKKPSRKHDWTPQELQLIALCIQCAALAIQLGALVVILVKR